MTAEARATIPLPEPQRLRKRWADLRLKAQQRWNQLKLLSAWWLRPHSPYRPVFVLATHRSGSNLLVDFLNHLPGVGCHSEVICHTLTFGIPRRDEAPQSAIRHIRHSLHAVQTPIRGCKIMLDQLQRCSLGLEDLDAAFPDARYLILYRASLAEQYVSRLSALATHQWVLFDGEERRHTQVYVSPTRLRAYCEQTRQAYRALLDHAWLPSRSVVLSYEELTEDPAWWVESHICPLIDAEFTPPKTSLRKQNTAPLADRVSNYREVAALLASPLCHQHYSWQRYGARRRAA
jgi:LPS sulfotransferase NodH